MDVGDVQTLPVTAFVTGNGPAFILSFDADDDQIVSLKWGDWNSGGDKIDLSVTGLKAGSVFVTISIKDAEDESIVHAAKRVKVTVNGPPAPSQSPAAEYRLIPGSSVLTLDVGEVQTLPVTAVYGDLIFLRCEMSDSSLAGLAWGEWNSKGDMIDLHVTGVKAGTGVITINMIDAADSSTVRTSVKITVTVRNKDPEPTPTPTPTPTPKPAPTPEYHLSAESGGLTLDVGAMQGLQITAYTQGTDRSYYLTRRWTRKVCPWASTGSTT